MRTWEDIPLHAPSSLRDFNRSLVHSPLDAMDGLLAEDRRLVRFQLPRGGEVLLVASHRVAAELLGRHWQTCLRSPVYGEVVTRLTGPGLLTTEGEQWAAARRVMSRALSSPLLPAPGSLVPEVVRQWLRDLLRAPFSLAEGARSLAWRAVLGWVLAGDRGATSDLKGLLPLLFDELDRCHRLRLVGLPSRSPPSFEQGVGRLTQLLEEAIAANGAKSHPPPGFLTWAVHSPEAEWLRENPERLLTQLRTLVFAGLVTTSDALFWTLWLTMANPEEAETLGRQLRELPEADLESQRTLVRPWVAESLRLYPPVWMMERVTVAPVRLDDLEIPAGKAVAVYVRGAQRDPLRYPEPDRFVPARVPDPGTLAFTTGGHLCYGRDLALAELEVGLALLLRKSRLEGTEEFLHLQPDPGLTLPPASSPRVTLVSAVG